MAEASPFDLRLSQAASWARCAAFVRMNKTPGAAILESASDNTVRDEGTAMHWIAEQLLKGIPICTTVAPNGVVITDELLDGAQFYVDMLSEHGTDWHIEEQLAAPMIHARCGGTPDAFSFRADSAPTILLADLKGGYRPVEVFPNDQLFGYTAAIISAYPQYDNPETIVEYAIVQPRAFHRNGPVRTHTMRLRDIYPQIIRLHNAAESALGEHAHAVAGPQCDDCAGRASCSIAHAAGMRALEVAGEPDVHDLPVAAIDYEMLRLEEAARMIEARLTGLQAQASHLIRRGEMFMHYTLASGEGRLGWIDESAERAALAMGDLIGMDLRKPTQAVTPTQAMQRMPRELLERYTQRKRGAVKLVRFDGNAPAKAFSHLAIKKD